MGLFPGYLCNSLVSSAKKALWISFPYGKINLLSEVTYMKKKSFPLLVLSLPLILCGCGNQPAPSSSSGSETSSSSSSASKPSTAKEVNATQVYHFGETFGEDEITAYFRSTLESQGGFNQGNLNALLAKYPKKQGKDIRRKIASLVLQNPYIENRYCHDDPRLINATMGEKRLAYKVFQ